MYRQPVCIYDADHDYILDEIERRDHIEYERKIHNDDKYELCINDKLHILKVYMYVIQHINRNVSLPIYSLM